MIDRPASFPGSPQVARPVETSLSETRPANIAVTYIIRFAWSVRRYV